MDAFSPLPRARGRGQGEGELPDESVCGDGAVESPSPRPSPGGPEAGTSRSPHPSGRGGSNSRFHAGFTVVELAVVAAMIAILAAMAVPVARYSLRRQKELELRYELRVIRDAIDKYKALSDSGQIPIQIGGEGYPPDLDTLVKGVTLVGQLDKKQKFLRRIPIDPMTGKAEWGLRSYQDEHDSFAWGGQNVYDVYSQSEATGLDGTKYKDW